MPWNWLVLLNNTKQFSKIVGTKNSLVRGSSVPGSGMARWPVKYSHGPPLSVLTLSFRGRGGQLSHHPKNRKYKWKDFALSLPLHPPPPPPTFLSQHALSPWCSQQWNKTCLFPAVPSKVGWLFIHPQETSSLHWKGLPPGM